MVSLLRSLTASVAVLATVTAAASEDCTADAMLVFDGSGSMAEMGFNLLDRPRILEAREAVHAVMPHIAPVRRLGLIVYGPGDSGGCGNIALRFAPMRDAGPRVVAEIDGLQPDGETPLTEAVAQAAGVLLAGSMDGTVVLVTDGKETCNGSPCELAAQLAADAPGLTVHVIGFKVRSDHFGWVQHTNIMSTTVAECLAEQTGGRYVPAESVDELAEALDETLGCRLISRAPQGVRPG